MSKWMLVSDKPDFGRMKKRESVWTQGNGYMGVRASFEEAYTNAVRNTLINGVFDCPKGEVPELAVIPDATNCDLTLDKICTGFFKNCVGFKKTYYGTKSFCNASFRRCRN